MLLRRHSFVILIRLAFLFIMFLFPVVLGFMFFSYLESNGLVPIYLFLLSVWSALLWQVAFYAITMHLLDVWIVTDRRIIDSIQRGFFARTISELHISRVQDISVNISGPIATFLHFGDLQVQTAGADEKFKFEQIHNPEKVKDEIMKVVHHTQ